MDCIHHPPNLLHRGFQKNAPFLTNSTQVNALTSAPLFHPKPGIPLASLNERLHCPGILRKRVSPQANRRPCLPPSRRTYTVDAFEICKQGRRFARWRACNCGVARESPDIPLHSVTSQQTPELSTNFKTLARSVGILFAVSLAGLGFIPLHPGHASPMQTHTSHSLSKNEKARESVGKSPSDSRRGEGVLQGSLAEVIGYAESSGVEDAEVERKEGGSESSWGHLEPSPITVPLNIVALRGSVPLVWLKEFMTLQGKQAKLSVSFVGTLDGIVADMRSALRQGKAARKSAMAADLITLSDVSLSPAVAAGLVAPIHSDEVEAWVRRLGPRWERLLRLDRSGHADPEGQVWALPYRWGCTVIAYRKDKLKSAGVKAPTDWADLWNPCLVGRVGMVDSPREVVGAVLKSLGASYNARDFERDVPGGRKAVRHQFGALRRQVRLFDSEQHLKALAAGDVWVVVGWSSDILPVAQRSPNLAVIAPVSGTSLWADLWAVPATYRVDGSGLGGRVRGPSPLVSQWLDFCLQPARSLAFKRHIFSGASPFTLHDSSSSSSQNLHHSSSEANEEKKGGAGSGDEEKYRQQEEGHQGRVRGGSPERAYGPSIEGNIVDGIPPDEVMSRSEFMVGLEDDAKKQYKWLMESALEGEAERRGGLLGRLAGVPLLNRVL